MYYIFTWLLLSIYLLAYVYFSFAFVCVRVTSFRSKHVNTQTLIFTMYSFSSQHRDICEFPSFMFYEDKLRTSSSVDDRDKKVKRTKEFLHFWPCHKDKDYVPLVFCHVAGEERELAVTTEQGNQRSKSNLREKDKVVSLNSLLVNFLLPLLLFSSDLLFQSSRIYVEPV